jgi:hypothetical protein
VRIPAATRKVTLDFARSFAKFDWNSQSSTGRDNLCLVRLKIAIDAWLLLGFAIYVWTIPARFVQIYLAISVPRATRLDVTP